MFTNNFKLDGIENILDDIGYLDEMKGAGEDQEHKYTKKSGKKSKDYDQDGTVEDETDEYAGVKDRAIKKAMKKEEKETCSKCNKKPCECDDVEESCGSTHGKKKKMVEDVDFSSVLEELTDEDLLFLTDELIEEVVEEFFYETLEEGFEIDELETILLEQVESELEYLEEAKVTVGHDSDVKPEASRTSKLAKVKDAVKKVASGAKAVAKKVAGAAGEVAGSAVAGYKKASAAAADRPSSGSSSDDSKSDTANTGSKTPRSSSASTTKATGTKRPGLLGRVGAALKSGLKKAIHGAGKAAGKVVKTAKAGYDEGRGKTAPASTSAPAAKPSAKPTAKPAAKKPAAKKGSNLDNLLNKIRNEDVDNSNLMPEELVGTTYEIEMEDGETIIIEKMDGKDDNGFKSCWKGYRKEGTKMKGGKEVNNCVKAGYEPEGEQLDEEAQFLADVEMVADWLYAEGVIEDEDQFFELMEDLSEEEIEELYDLVLSELYKGKHGQSETEYQDSRSNAGKMVSGTSKLSGAAYSSRGVKNTGPNPAGGSKKPQGQGRMTSGQRTEMQYRKANLKKAEGYEMIGTSLEEGGLEVQNIQEISANLALRASKAADIKRGKLAAAGDKEGAAGKAAQAKRLYDKQAAKRLGRQEDVEMIGTSLEDGGLEVRNYSWKEVMESQYARNNPEKYEAEQKKKTAKGAMPPRGDKRREDFEKWYAKNVR